MRSFEVQFRLDCPNSQAFCDLGAIRPEDLGGLPVEFGEKLSDELGDGGVAQGSGDAGALVNGFVDCDRDVRHKDW